MWTFCFRTRANTDKRKSLKQFKKMASGTTENSQTCLYKAQVRLNNKPLWISLTALTEIQHFYVLKRSLFWNINKCENLVVFWLFCRGLCPRGAKISAQFFLVPCCVSCVFWDCSGPMQGEPRTLQRFNNYPEFLQYNSPICAFEFGNLIWSHSYRMQLISSSSS